MGIGAAVRIYAIPLSEGSPSHTLDVETTRVVTRGLIRRVFLAGLGCVPGKTDRLTQIGHGSTLCRLHFARGTMVKTTTLQGANGRRLCS
jgi:hypothetical protein